MRLRTELLAGASLAVALMVGAAALGAHRARTLDTDPRRSTLLAGPWGAMGFGQALERLGVRVERWRRPPANIAGGALEGRTVVAVINPTRTLTSREAKGLIEMPTDLLLVGSTAAAAMACVGYRVVPAERALVSSADRVMVRALLEAEADRVVTDSPDTRDGIAVTCRGPVPRSADTVLMAQGKVAALRLHYDDGRAVTLVADDEIFANRALRTTPAGPFALGLVVGRYDRIIVDEYHHGFVTSGSLMGALIGWSLRSPWGWAVWQLAIVGLIGLLVSGVRFGPVQPFIDRRRRSPLEHVRALATALAAARGHATAVALMVRGLRRRLSRGGRASADDDREWLDGLRDTIETAEGRRALDTLQDLTNRPVSTDDVRRAANAVEDVWEELMMQSPGKRSPNMLPPLPRS